MCLIVFSINQHPQFPLVMAANRDEFFRRPTAGMEWWHSEAAGEEVLAGRDLLSGGTWLAVSRSGRISAVTNVRELPHDAGQRSRGELPLLAQRHTPEGLQSALLLTQKEYAGFNLVHADTESGWYFSNRDPHPGRHVQRGTYGLSNHLLQTPWPKLLKLRNEVTEKLRTATSSDADQLHQSLIDSLQDTTPAPDHELPDTGVGLDMERFLSSPFIKGTEYGTRATTIVTQSASGEMLVTEQAWGPNAQKSEQQQFRWQRSP